MVPARKITPKEVQRLAALACLQLTKKDEEGLTRELGQILAYFEKISKANTEGVPPTYHVIPIANVYRDDKVEAFDSDKLLEKVPEAKGRYVKAPRIL